MHGVIVYVVLCNYKKVPPGWLNKKKEPPAKDVVLRI
jgi:hypothetical protein